MVRVVDEVTPCMIPHGMDVGEAVGSYLYGYSKQRTSRFAFQPSTPSGSLYMLLKRSCSPEQDTVKR